MTRKRSFLIVGLTALVGASSPLSAQGDRPRDPRDPPPITWCEKKAPNTTWKRQPVSFGLWFTSADSSAKRILGPYLPFLLEGIAKSFAAEWQPSRPVDAKIKVKDLPAGEPRYGPIDLLNPSILFDLVGNGTIDSIVALDTTGSKLSADLKAALMAAAARGDVFGPYADSTIRTRLELTAALGEWGPTFPSWLAFTLYAPVGRPIRPDHRNRTPVYPAEGLGWDGKLVFLYMVDENGQAVVETAKVVGAEGVVWKSERYRLAFEGFRTEVIKALGKMRYKPEERLGCSIAAWAQQEFIFTMKSGPAIP